MTDDIIAIMFWVLVTAGVFKACNSIKTSELYNQSICKVTTL